MEEDLDLSFDRLLMMMMHNYKTEFGSKYVGMRTECNITPFEHPFNYKF